MSKNLNIVDYKNISNLCDFFKYQLTKNPSKYFLFKKKKTWEGYTYQELNNKISKVINFLLKKKVSKGDRILLISNNRIEWFVCDMAIMSVGAISVPSFSTNNVTDNEFIFKDSKPKIIILENEKIFNKNIKIFKNHKTKILLLEKCSSFISFLDLNTKNLDSVKLPVIKNKDISSIIYTSGTSGNPKGVMLSHESIIHNCEAAYNLLKSLNINKERFLSFLPLSHSYERMAGLYFPLSIGAQIFYCNSLEKINQDFLETKPTLVTAVPRLYESIYRKIKVKINKSGNFSNYLFQITLKLGDKKRNKNLTFIEQIFNFFLTILIRKKIRNIFGGKLKTFVSGGAALDPKIGDFFLNMGCTILQGYGQTEASPLISCNSFDDNKTSTVGKPVKNVKVKISNSGEILVQGKNIMLGYWNNEFLTKKTIKNNWLHTGDLGFFDNKKRLVINGRKKDLIVTSGGENISPQKIESLLLSNEEIIQAVVYGNSKPYLIAVLVSDKKTTQKQLTKIISDINSKLNKPERIRKFIITNNEFTYSNGLLTQTLKIKKDAVHEHFFNQIQKLYSNS